MENNERKPLSIANVHKIRAHCNKRKQEFENKGIINYAKQPRNCKQVTRNNCWRNFLKLLEENYA